MIISPVETAGTLMAEREFPNAYAGNLTAQQSAVSWGAIIAGAAAAAALSLILLVLGTGLGLSSVSPWAQSGVSSTTFGVSTILWITLTQIVASAMGGYLAGRLRIKWTAVHTDEVYFRDTAHGFLAWAVASLATAALLSSVIASIVGTGVQAGAAVAGGAGSAAIAATASNSESSKSDAGIEPVGYFVDSLLRKDMGAGTSASVVTASSVAISPGEPSAGASRSEVSGIFMNSVRTGTLPAEDLRYLGQVVAQRTGLSQQDAEKRVSDTYARLQARLRDTEISVKAAADKARKVSAYTALWLFISLLIGAFAASLAATYGGRQREF
ncbi:hypothetical protein [Polaromonas sp. OV174]|uniref:hypothetical protein n=1 Tax=Polaromonas sp. OV174 TaxID=1855300 RepID=UPI002100CD1A|nr:hypothetical protein [Polaromonas sp. OV174]